MQLGKLFFNIALTVSNQRALLAITVVMAIAGSVYTAENWNSLRGQAGAGNSGGPCREPHEGTPCNPGHCCLDGTCTAEEGADGGICPEDDPGGACWVCTSLGVECENFGPIDAATCLGMTGENGRAGSGDRWACNANCTADEDDGGGGEQGNGSGCALCDMENPGQCEIVPCQTAGNFPISECADHCGGGGGNGNGGGNCWSCEATPTGPICDDGYACGGENTHPTFEICMAHPPCPGGEVGGDEDSGGDPRCGDGRRDAGEECDGSDAEDCPDACRADCTCQKPECSDGIDNADPEDELADEEDPGCYECPVCAMLSFEEGEEPLGNPYLPARDDEGYDCKLSMIDEEDSVTDRGVKSFFARLLADGGDVSAGEACLTLGDCVKGYYCDEIDRVCKKGKGCITNHDCTDGNSCNTDRRVCVSSVCTVDANCGVGESCSYCGACVLSSSMCIPGDDRSCPDGYECGECGTCVSPSNKKASECARAGGYWKGGCECVCKKPGIRRAPLPGEPSFLGQVCRIPSSCPAPPGHSDQSIVKHCRSRCTETFDGEFSIEMCVADCVCQCRNNNGGAASLCYQECMNDDDSNGNDYVCSIHGKPDCCRQNCIDNTCGLPDEDDDGGNPDGGNQAGQQGGANAGNGGGNDEDDDPDPECTLHSDCDSGCCNNESCQNVNCPDGQQQLDCGCVEDEDEACGNNILEDGEECDDGNTEDGDRCSSTCTVETFCGDGEVQEEPSTCPKIDWESCGDIPTSCEPIYHLDEMYDAVAEGRPLVVGETGISGMDDITIATCFRHDFETESTTNYRSGHLVLYDGNAHAGQGMCSFGYLLSAHAATVSGVSPPLINGMNYSMAPTCWSEDAFKATHLQQTPFTGWVHGAGVYQKDGNWHMYHDGESLEISSYEGRTNRPVNEAGGPLYIGGSRDRLRSNRENIFSGQIADVRIYDCALPASEIEALAECCPTSDCVITGGEQCDNGSVCAQNPSISCKTDSDCSKCYLVGSEGHCGGTEGGSSCTSDADCVDEYYTCEYDYAENEECSDTCEIVHGSGPECGDGNVDDGEECDDGPFNSDEVGAFCTTSCTLVEEDDDEDEELCGNGVRDAGEECDAGENNSNEPNAACRADCTEPDCGDGIVDDLSGERCDEGDQNANAPGAVCLTNCLFSGCGDGIVSGDEQCDDANKDPTDGCDNFCKESGICGDGIVSHNETCDTALDKKCFECGCNEPKTILNTHDWSVQYEPPGTGTDTDLFGYEFRASVYEEDDRKLHFFAYRNGNEPILATYDLNENEVLLREFPERISPLAAQWDEDEGLGYVLFDNFGSTELRIFDPEERDFIQTIDASEFELGNIRDHLVSAVTHEGNGRVYFFGGDSADVGVFDPASQSFSVLEDVFEGTYSGVAPVYADGQIYLLGGYVKHPDGWKDSTNTIYRFDPSGSLELESHLGYPTMDGAAVWTGVRIMHFGGSTIPRSKDPLYRGYVDGHRRFILTYNPQTKEASRSDFHDSMTAGHFYAVLGEMSEDEHKIYLYEMTHDFHNKKKNLHRVLSYNLQCFELEHACGDGDIGYSAVRESDRINYKGMKVQHYFWSPYEECDDGNRDNDDGCNAVCWVEEDCGNGLQEGSEQCDAGSSGGGSDNGDTTIIDMGNGGAQAPAIVFDDSGETEEGLECEDCEAECNNYTFTHFLNESPWAADAVYDPDRKLTWVFGAPAQMSSSLAMFTYDSESQEFRRTKFSVADILPGYQWMDRLQPQGSLVRDPNTGKIYLATMFRVYMDYPTLLQTYSKWGVDPIITSSYPHPYAMAGLFALVEFDPETENGRVVEVRQLQEQSEVADQVRLGPFDLPGDGFFSVPAGKAIWNLGSVMRYLAPVNGQNSLLSYDPDSETIDIWRMGPANDMKEYKGHFFPMKHFAYDEGRDKVVPLRTVFNNNNAYIGQITSAALSPNAQIHEAFTPNGDVAQFGAELGEFTAPMIGGEHTFYNPENGLIYAFTRAGGNWEDTYEVYYERTRRDYTRFDLQPQKWFEHNVHVFHPVTGQSKALSFIGYDAYDWIPAMAYDSDRQKVLFFDAPHGRTQGVFELTLDCPVEFADPSLSSSSISSDDTSSEDASSSTSSEEVAFCGDGIVKPPVTCDENTIDPNSTDVVLSPMTPETLSVIADSEETVCTEPDCVCTEDPGEECDGGENCSDDCTCPENMLADGAGGCSEIIAESSISSADTESNVSSDVSADSSLSASFGEESSDGETELSSESSAFSIVLSIPSSSDESSELDSSSQSEEESSSSLSIESASSFDLDSSFDADSSLLPAAGQCGDGTVSGPEQCDDGNDLPGDGCNERCKLEKGGPDDDDGDGDNDDGTSDNDDDSPVCGDGLKEDDEECDDRNTRDGDGCSSTCILEEDAEHPVCGDGIITHDEECDDGNTRNGDDCSSRCLIEAGCTGHADCPSGRCYQGSCYPCTEDSECAEGICINGICSAQTLVAAASTCGNGVLDIPEECDDANRRDGDGCSSTCLLELGICGDGLVQKLMGEQCETAKHSPSLPYGCVNCRFYSYTCGDGTIDSGEECDDGVRNSVSSDARCRPDCSLARCGDGVIDSTEICDDGNRIPGDGCSQFCQPEDDGETVVASDRSDTAPDDSLGAPNFGFGAFGQHVGFQQQFGQQFGFPQYPNMQALPRQLPYAQLQPFALGQAPAGDTGPAAIAVFGAGAAAGFGWMRRRKK